MIVGCRDEDVSQRVESEGPHVGVVGLRERRARSGLRDRCAWYASERGRSSRQVPVENCTFRAAGYKNRVNRMPGDSCEVTASETNA